MILAQPETGAVVVFSTLEGDRYSLGHGSRNRSWAKHSQSSEIPEGNRYNSQQRSARPELVP